MNDPYSPLRITLTGQFAAALRLAAETDKRTMIAFLEVNLPLLPPYALAMKTLKAAEPVPVVAPSAVLLAAPVAVLVPSKAVLPPLPDMTGFTNVQCQEARAEHHAECMAINDAQVVESE